MNRLPTPPPLPVPPALPAEVRERALRTVLAGIDAPPRRRAPFLAAAAAVVVALTVSTVVAVSGPRTDGGLDQLASTRPVTTGDPVTDPALLRCADAVQAAGRSSSYPPTRTWRSTAVLFHDRVGDTAIAVNDAFGCFVAPSGTFVSQTRGTPAGAAAIALLTPATGVVLNPERVSITINDGVIRPASTAPVQYVEFGRATMVGQGYTINAFASYDGPLPAPAPIGVQVQDQPPQSQAPPPGSMVQGGTALDDCLAIEAPGVHLGLTLDARGVPAARAGTVGDGFGAFCVTGRSRLVFAAGAMPLPADRTAPTVVALSRTEGVTGVLVAVPASSVRAEIEGSPCAVGGGLALCSRAGTGAATVTVYDSTGRPASLPLP